MEGRGEKRAENAKLTPLKPPWRDWLEEKKGGKPNTHLVTTTKDQYWTKIESYVGNDLASQPWEKKKI